MNFRISLVATLALGLALGLGATQAEAASCSVFASIKAYDADAKMVELKYEKGTESKFFPKPEGAPPTSKIPTKCKRKITRATKFPVKPTGGRLSVTQVRSNFEGKMRNDTDDAKWLPNQLEGLIKDKTVVVVVLRPGKSKKDPVPVTTIYLPITEEEKAEILRLENQAEDV